MLTLEQIRRRLEPMNIQHVSRETGLHPNSLYRIASGKTSAGYQTVRKLSDWLEGQHASTP